MGVQMNYQGINLPDSYGSSHKMTGEFGILYLINEHWKIGAAVFNFANARLSEYYDDRLTSALKLGVNFAPSKKVQILVDLSKDLDYPMISVHAGAEYAILTNLFLRLGVSTKPETFSLGFGYQLKSFRFDLSTQYHPTLGLKPQFGLVYSK